LTAFKNLLCGVSVSIESEFLYPFSDDNSTKPYVFYDDDITDVTKPERTDLLIKILTDKIAWLEYIKTHPASAYYAQKDAFDYDKWNKTNETKINEKIALFTNAFKNVTYKSDGSGSIKTYGGSLGSWDAFWAQSVTGGTLASQIKTDYNGLDQKDKQAFKFLFLKELDEAKALNGTDPKANFSSDNAAQLRDILSAFDRCCLGIFESVNNASGFLKKTDTNGTKSQTDFSANLTNNIPANPASTYYFQKANFNYDTWDKEEETSISSAITLFTNAFKNVTYESDKSINSYGKDLTDWATFWAQTVGDEGTSLATQINTIYTGLDEGNIPAFQYLFLKALDGVTKANFSSSNVTQLKGILGAFDEHCLEIGASENPAIDTMGFLQTTDDEGTESSTNFGTQLDTESNNIPVNPASTYYSQKAAFNYDTWDKGGETSINSAITLFTNAFANVTYNTNGSITTNWTTFWSQSVTGDILASKIKTAYNGLTQDAKKAFQYLFLKALDGVTKTTSSSSNVTQLKDILSAFDEHCLGILESAVGASGFLQTTNENRIESATPLKTALPATGTIEPEADYTWNQTAIETEVVKYPGSGTINPTVNVKDVSELSPPVDSDGDVEECKRNIVNACWEYFLEVYAHNLFYKNSVVIDMDAFNEALNALVASLQTNGHLASDDDGYDDQQTLFANLQEEYDAICDTITAEYTMTDVQKALSLEDLENLKISRDLISILTDEGKISDTGCSLVEDNVTVIQNMINAWRAEQNLSKQEEMRYNIISALAAPYVRIPDDQDIPDDQGTPDDQSTPGDQGTPGEQVALTIATIKSILNDSEITEADAATTKIFDSTTHDIFKLLNVLDGTGKVGTGPDTLLSVLNSVSEAIGIYNENLTAIFEAETSDDLSEALQELIDYGDGAIFPGAKTKITNALTANENTADPLQKIIIENRLQNIKTILDNFDLLREHIALCVDDNYTAYKARVGASNAMSENEWNATIAGTLAAIRAESSLNLAKLKTFSTQLNDLLGQKISESDDVPDPEAAGEGDDVPDPEAADESDHLFDPETARAVSDVLNCSKAIEKLLLVSTLQEKLGDENGVPNLDKKGIIQKFLYGEEALPGSEAMPYTGILEFRNDTATLTFGEVLTLSMQEGGISNAALIGDAVQKLSDLVDINHIGASLGGIFTGVSQEIEYVYNLSQIPEALLGEEPEPNELLNALKSFSDEMFSASPSLDGTAIGNLQTIENLTLSEINKSNESHSLSVLIEAYNEAAKFFRDTLSRPGALTGIIQTKINEVVNHYNDENPSDYIRYKNELQTSLASANGLLTIFETIFNSLIDPTNASAYREVLSMIHTQLRLKIDAKIQTLKN
ncbi:MAG: hypothetical protein LBJ89_00230, partial [Holosporales bacterium]|nr:hypothetical protein [Holosporales bacterium]